MNLAVFPSGLSLNDVDDFNDRPVAIDFAHVVHRSYTLSIINHTVWIASIRIFFLVSCF